MDFRIADTFVDSLARLTSDEQKAVKTTAFDLQLNPANPGMRLHRLERAKDPCFWSARVSNAIRLILHRTADSLLLCYVGHHDDAYRWAERRKLQTHPTTGAAQFVEIRETVRDIVIPQYTGSQQPTPPKPPLFTGVAEQALLGYGVPEEWLADVRAADEDTLLDLVDHLPGEAAEALLELATGGQPRINSPPVAADPFAHPDAQRRFRMMTNSEELARALDYPWEKWTTFLHPAQRQGVERDYNGPARVSGSAGTGKTIVALHRAVHLARAHPEARVLLTTFSETLANALRIKLRRLIGNQPRLAERLEVQAMDAIGQRLYAARIGPPTLAPRDRIHAWLTEAAEATDGLTVSPGFLMTEWDEVVDAWQLENWDAYRDVRRLGRKTRLPEARRALLWSVFEQVRARLADQDWITPAGLFSQLAARLVDCRRPPFDFAVVDEAQDLGIPQLKFLAALGGRRPNGLFFAGDLGQRIFQPPFSWKALGVEVRGRSRTLAINYRTSHQIRQHADRLLASVMADVDGNIHERQGTVSLYNGPEPTLAVLNSVEEEIHAVGAWLARRRREGIAPQEMGVFVRSPAELERGRRAVAQAGLDFKVLDDQVETTSGHVSISTMHRAKGLEFRAVVVLACDDEIIPRQARIETVADEADLEEVYNTERHLLYVACTRARDHLLVSGVEPASEFLEDLKR